MSHATPTPGRAMRAAGPALALPVSDDDDYEAARAAGLIASHGHHARWCASGDPSGVTVAEHGALCESMGFPVDAWGSHHEPRTVWAYAVEPYRHGTYQPEDVVGRPPRPFIRLSWEEDDPRSTQHWGAFLTPGEARSLAAALVRLADAAEQLDRLPYRAGVAR